MKIVWPAGLLLLLLSGCPSGSPANTTPTAAPPVSSIATPEATASVAVSEEFLITENGFGPITAESTQVSLEERFGKEQVKAGEIPGAEGLMLPGLLVFPDQPDKQVSVFLTEETPPRVSHLQLAGQASQWKTTHGISLGTTLAELEKLNGKPFELTGFGWDYGGYVTDWKGGALEGMMIRLLPANQDLSEEESAAVSGDQTIASDLAALAKADAKVSEISLVFVRPDATPSPSGSPAP